MSDRRQRVDEWTAKVLMIAVSVWMLGEAVAIAQAPDALAIGKRAETLGIIGILAAVIVILAVALVMVYKGKEAAALRREERLEKLVEQTATALAGDAETRRDTNVILVEFKSIVERCRRNGGA